MKIATLILGLILCPSIAFGQFYHDQATAGLYTGYRKVSDAQVLLKLNYRYNCVFPGVGTPAGSVLTKYTSPWDYTCGLVLNNVDSSSKATFIKVINALPVQGNPQSTTFDLKLVNQNCHQCSTANNDAQIGVAMLRYHNEYVLDSTLVISGSPSSWINIDTNMQSISVFPGIQSVFTSDSIALGIRNIVPWTAFPQPYGYFTYHSARVFRWKDYSNINSPELTNKNVILAVKGKPLTYNFGIVDSDHDSINVISLTPSYSKNPGGFHPSHSTCAQGLPLSPSSQNFIRQAFSDSSLTLSYQIGYSSSQPFG